MDAWQPEAYVFLSLYTSALMTVSTALIVGALYALLLGEQTGKWKYPVIAGICGGILGNMHSYDVLHISAAWGFFLIVLTVLKRGQGVGMSWLRGIVALALTAPTTLYVFYMYQKDAVFQKRANVPTLSPRMPIIFHGHTVFIPAPWHYFLGYGFVFLLALLAAGLIMRQRGQEAPTPGGSRRPLPPQAGEGLGEERASSALVPSPGTGEGGEERAGWGFPLPLLFALCWAVAGLAICYLPFAFQRKMLMGEHIPLCLLAGVGAAWLAQRFTPRVQSLTLALLVLASAPSNALFLTRDLRHLETTKARRIFRRFWHPALLDVYHWLRANTPPDAAVVGFPGTLHLPARRGRPRRLGRPLGRNAGIWLAKTPSSPMPLIA